VFAEYESAGAAILGESLDDAASHKAFAAKNQIPYKLLVDPEGSVTKLYGVPTPNGFAKRVTFLIDKDGKIVRTWDKVTVKGHSDEVLAALKALPK
jgi:peroxiredoxin Q/BCP